MKHNSKSTLTTKYSAGEQIVMDRNVSLRYNKSHHIMEEKVMGKRKSVLKTATAAALTGEAAAKDYAKVGVTREGTTVADPFDKITATSIIVVLFVTSIKFGKLYDFIF